MYLLSEGGPTVRLRRTPDLKTVGQKILARRVDLPGVQLGFGAPPCPINIKFFELKSGWVLVGMTAPGKPPVAARWLEKYDPASIQIAPGLSPKVIRATFNKLPPAWEKLLTTVVVHYLELTPDGSASVFVEDSIEKVQRFVTDVQAVDSKARARQTLSGAKRVSLTARQQEILSLAVALGYYELPHKLNLRTLAKKVGLSVGAVSELLRRGEALIITNYVDEFSASRWEGTGRQDEPAPHGEPDEGQPGGS